MRMFFPLICSLMKGTNDFIIIANHPSVVACDFFTLKSILLEGLKKLSVLENAQHA